MAAPLPPCSHRPTCPGCPRYGEPGIADAALAKLRALAERHGAALDAPVAGDALGSRHRARLMVRGRAGSPKIGLFQRGSHRVADIPHCGIHHPLVNEVAAAAKDAIRRTGAQPYADAPHRGLVRALQVVVERSSATAQVVVVANDAMADASVPLLDALADLLGARLHSLWWNGNPARANTLIGPHWRRVRGPEAVGETIGGADVFYPPGAFGQSHLALADRIVAHVHACVPPDARVAELYAGSGAIGLGLLRRGQRVAFNELSEGGLRGLALGLAAQTADARARAEVVPGAAGECAALVDAADVVVADPPRKGLDAALCDALAQRAPQRLVYLSCDVDSLATDAAALVAGGGLALQRLVPYALFPFTEHVETLAVFDAAVPTGSD